MPDGAFLAAPAHVVMQVVAEAYKPAPPVDYNAWAVAHVRFGRDSQFPGPYNPELFAFFKRILEVLGPDHPVREVVLMKSAQIGGTVLAMIFLGGSMDLDPGPFLYVHPTIDNGLRWMRQKWKPLLRKGLEEGTAFGRIFPHSTSRDGNSSLTYQERRDGRGFLQVSGANSEASLSMMSMPRQVQDDLSKWENNNAGDPEVQANSRSKAFEWAKIFKLGTPLLHDNCRVTRNFERSTQEFYYVPCPHCGHMQVLEWENLQGNIEAHPEDDPFFSCTDCGGVIEQHHRLEMLKRGEWRATNPGAAMIGFHLWAAYSPIESWKRIRDDWLNAKGDPAREQAFLNDTVGRAYKAAGEAPPWEEIRTRAEEDGHKLGVIPPGGLILTAGADCQGDRVEVHVKAFGQSLKSWTIQYEVIDGHISEEETRTALDAFLKRSWPDSFGNRRGLDQFAIDANAYTDDVLDWCRKHQASKVMAVRGANSDAAPIIAKVQRERSQEGKIRKGARGRFFNIGVSQLKMALYKNLKKNDPLERGYCGFPKGLEEEFYRQLTAERRQPVKQRTGFVAYRWVKDATQRNEVLDTELYAQAAAIRIGWRQLPDYRWDELRAALEVVPEKIADLEDLLVPPPAPAKGQASKPVAEQTGRRMRPARW